MGKLVLVVRRIEAFLLVSAILTMALVTVANVAVRNIDGGTIAFAEELNGFLIVLVCFVGLSHAAGKGRHIRMSALGDALPLRARRWLMFTVALTTAILLFAFSWYALRYALGVERRSPVLGLPLGRVYLIAPFGLFLGGIQYLMTAWRNRHGERVWVAFDREDGPEELLLEEGGEAS